MRSPNVPSPPSRAARRRPRRARLAAVGLVLAAGTLTGCQIQNQPTSYDDADGVVGRNFMQACTGRIPNQSTTTLLSTEATCECAFEVFKTRVPFDEDDRGRVGSGYPADAPTFQDLEPRLREDVANFDDLPQDIRDAIQECNRVGQVGPNVPGSAPPPEAGTTSTTNAPPATDAPA